MTSEIVIVGKYQYEHEAELARASLEAEGVQAAILDNAGSMLPSVPLGLFVRLAVLAPDAELARQILADNDRALPDPPPDEP